MNEYVNLSTREQLQKMIAECYESLEEDKQEIKYWEGCTSVTKIHLEKLEDILASVESRG